MNPQESVNPMSSSNAILDALVARQRQGETSLIVTIKPSLVQDAMNALRDHRKLFAPFVPGETDTSPIYATYERMRQANAPEPTILLLVECQTMKEFREALSRLPIRKSSEWRSLDNDDYWERYLHGTNDEKVF